MKSITPLLPAVPRHPSLAQAALASPQQPPPEPLVSPFQAQQWEPLASPFQALAHHEALTPPRSPRRSAALVSQRSPEPAYLSCPIDAAPPTWSLDQPPPGSHAFDVHMRRLPAQHIGAMFIDHSRYVGDALAFDYGFKAEPGYAAAMVRAFAHVRATMTQPIDADAYERLHAMAATGVQAPTLDERERADMAPRYAPQGQHSYGLHCDEVTAAGWRELDSAKLIWVSKHAACFLRETALPGDLLALWRTRDQAGSAGYLSELRCYGPRHVQVGPAGGDFRYYLADDRGAARSDPTDYAARARGHVSALCDRYHEQLARAGSANDRLLAIVGLCRALEIGHFFVDGNQRTTAFLLLNKLLMQNGLAPCILPRPVVFDGYLSVRELVAKVREGQGIFDRLCRAGAPG